MYINSKNIESLIIDYVENKLDSNSRKEFCNAINLNKEYLDLLNLYISSNNFTIQNDIKLLDNNFKEKLKHTSDFDDNDVSYFDRLAVLVNEKVATKREEVLFYKLILKDNDKISCAGLYANSKIFVDKSINYKYKNLLKHKETSKIFKFSISIAAAIIFLMIGFYIFFKYNNVVSTDIQSQSIVLNNNQLNNFNENLQSNENFNREVISEYNDLNKEVVNNNKVKNSINSMLSNVKNEYKTQENEPINQINSSSLTASNFENNEHIIRLENNIKLEVATPNILNSYIEPKNDEENIDFSFIGEVAISRIKEYKNKINSAEKNTINPKICLSRNTEGKICKVGVWFGEKQILLWAK